VFRRDVIAVSRAWRAEREVRIEVREADSVMGRGGDEVSVTREGRAPFGGPVGGIGWGSAWVWWDGEGSWVEVALF
jgi:hypothetical protein